MKEIRGSLDIQPWTKHGITTYLIKEKKENKQKQA